LYTKNAQQKIYIFHYSIVFCQRIRVVLKKKVTQIHEKYTLFLLTNTNIEWEAEKSDHIPSSSPQFEHKIFLLFLLLFCCWYFYISLNLFSLFYVVYLCVNVKNSRKFLLDNETKKSSRCLCVVLTATQWKVLSNYNAGFILEYQITSKYFFFIFILSHSLIALMFNNQF
jgi:hypothetical protein